MSYTTQTAFGHLTYYDNYNFDFVVQMSDIHGIMFANYTHERIKLTPPSSNIVAIFKIIKRHKMTTNKVTFETGATSHAVNDLILFTDNTRELAELRDAIYGDANACGDKIAKPEWFMNLLNKARAKYANELGGDNSLHIIHMTDAEKEEFKQLYANEFPEWRSEHGYK